MAAPTNPAARATGAAAGRGLLLIVVAVAIGLLLLRATVDEPDAVEAAPGTDTTAGTTVPGAEGEPDTTEPTDTTEPPDGEAPVTEAPGETVTTLPVDVRDPAEVLVQVVNAKTGVNGAAGRLTDQLEALGYVAAEPTNTIEEVLQDSLIYYEPGYLAEANKLATELNFAIQDVVQPLPSDPASIVDSFESPNVLVMLGVNQATAG